MNNRPTDLQSINILRDPQKHLSGKTYLNLVQEQKLKVAGKQYRDPDWKVEIYFKIDNEVKVSIIAFRSLITILSDIGGYGSIFFNITLLICYPFLYQNFNRSIVEAIKRKQREAGIQDSLDRPENSDEVFGGEPDEERERLSSIEIFKPSLFRNKSEPVDAEKVGDALLENNEEKRVDKAQE